MCLVSLTRNSHDILQYSHVNRQVQLTSSRWADNIKTDPREMSVNFLEGPELP